MSIFSPKMSIFSSKICSSLAFFSSYISGLQLKMSVVRCFCAFRLLLDEVKATFEHLANDVVIMGQGKLLFNVGSEEISLRKKV